MNAIRQAGAISQGDDQSQGDEKGKGTAGGFLSGSPATDHAAADPSAKDASVAESLDCLGLFCPQPLFQTREAIDRLEPGQVLEVFADDPAAEEDLRRFAKRAGHEVVTVEDRGDHKRLLIRKGA